MSGRLILDVSTLLRWTGPAVGIARVEHALAMAATDRADTVLGFYDDAADTFRALDPRWRDVVLGWSGAIDAHRPPMARWRLPGRQPVVALLERTRLTTRRAAIARVADHAQRALLGLRPHRFPLFDAHGARVANVPRDLALAEDLSAGPGDTVFAAGNGWIDRDPARIAALKGARGFRYAAICYDLIPVTHPHFYQPEVARDVATYWRAMLPTIDTLVVTADRIARDVGAFCETNVIAAPAMVRLPLGHDPPATVSAGAALPAGLRQGGYALFVSTIEPRKGHAMLLRAWRQLRARGVPLRADTRLVFVGRPGWMVDPVLAEIRAAGADGVVHLPRVDDPTLAALYDGAAFCLYPSEYEGFGLPVIEAFARGRALIASTGGAVPETVGGLGPCLDPHDVEAWAAAMERWIVDPDARAAAEARVRAGFVPRPWSVAAADILREIA